MAKTETGVTNLKINQGTYADIQTNLSSIGEDELIITDDKNIPIPSSNDSGKVVGVDNSGEFVLTAETDPVFTNSPAYGISSSDITAWNNKVDKTSTASQIYGTDSTGAQTTYGTVDTSLNIAQGKVPIYNANGCLKTSTPQSTTDCTRKDYTDGNDNKLSMLPSTSDVSVSITASGQTYSPTKNGYFQISAQSNASNGWVSIANSANSIISNHTLPSSGGWMAYFIPVKKGVTITITYGGIGSLYCNFISSEEV